jgi:hypothetical protein
MGSAASVASVAALDGRGVGEGDARGDLSRVLVEHREVLVCEHRLVS